MFRKFSTLLQSPFRQSGASLLRAPQIIRYPVALYSVTTKSNAPKTTSVFQQAKKPKAYTNFDRSKEGQTSPHSYAVDDMLNKSITNCLEIVNKENFVKQYNQKSLDNVIDKLWFSYIGIRNVLEKSERFQDARNSNQADLLSIYIPNMKINNKAILGNFEALITNLTSVYKQNEGKLLNSPQHLGNVLRCYTKFEKFHEREDFWEIIYRLTKKFLDKQGVPTFSDINTTRALLKALSSHKYYCKIRCSKNSQETDLIEALNKVKSVEEKAFKFIIQNKTKESLTGWMSVMFHFQLTNDELIASLPNLISQILQEDKSIMSEIPSCLNKATKFSGHPMFTDLIETMKNLALSNAAQNRLSIREISLILRALSQKNQNLPEKEFMTLWKNLNHNIKEMLTKDLDFLSVSSLLSSLVFNHHLSDERCAVLQQLAIVALGNLNKPNKFATHEKIDDENEGEEDGSKMSDYLVISESVKILGNLSQQQKVKSINLDLVRKLLTILQEKNQLIQRQNLSNLLLSCAKLHEKLQNNKQDVQVLDKMLIDLFKTINKRFIHDLHTCNAVDRAKAFIAYCTIQEQDVQIFNCLATAVHDKLSQLPVYYLGQTLRGISTWKAKNQTEMEHPIKEAIVEKTLNNVQDFSKEMFFDLLLNLGKMGNLASVRKLSSKVEAQLLSRIETFDLTQLCTIIFKNAQEKFLSPETLTQMIPHILQKLNEANIMQLSKIISAYVNTNIMPSDFFKILEEAALSYIKESLGKKVPAYALKDSVKIFSSLTRSKFENQELINTFETFFQENLEDIQMPEVIQIINGMVTYLSDNIDLMRKLLKTLNNMLKLDENQKELTQDTPSRLTQNFHLAMFSIELEYKQNINLEREYSDIYKIKRYLDENIQKVRYIVPKSAEYQAHIAEELKDLGYSFEEEYPVELFLVDIFIKPNIAVEVAGPNHYIWNTKTLDFRSQRRKRQLEKLGYKVVKIPYFEWMDVEKSTLKQKYLKEKIES